MFGFGTKQSNESSAATSDSVPKLSNMGGSNKVNQLKQQVREEMSVAQATELVQTMTKHCFEGCIEDQGESLTSNQQECASQCMALYTQVCQAIVP